MTSIWIHRLHAIMLEANANASNAFWTLIGEGDAEAQSYGVPLSATGEEPASHLGISSAFNREMLAKLKVLEGLGELLQLTYYLCDAWSFELLEQRNGTAEVGEVLDFNGALEDMGLVLIQPEEMP